ncbi:hypothetical protein TEA_012128 [Camellia sinensis var. sinensis]|uniref:Ubiquinone biosynthesis O-methyltransferase, mitochondrial n=1 Tax=Camellia sinensis var. sinensis TaxID=542762 RepID=A0A4S4EA50_CAMSN|nr:hypothetical protein TEA_012128 [Camellia sinensis var. sinensis]
MSRRPLRSGPRNATSIYLPPIAAPLPESSTMASKLLRNIRLLLPNPNPNFPLKRLTVTACQALHARPYSDVTQPVQIDPSIPKKPPIDGVTTVGKKTVNRGSNSLSSSLNEAELAKFAAIAETWWDAEGPFKPLHVMNPTRLTFIRSTLCRHFRKDPFCARPLEGLKIVDVGCGGGILSEPLARMGATVTAIDAVEKNIKIARLHAKLTDTIMWTEKLVEEHREFDAVIALEVIEHVADPSEFCKSLAALTVSDGATLISTINRSMRSYATAIIAAEYILHWLPKGTHQWSSFLTPEELALILHRASITVQEMAGFVYNPLTGGWTLSDDISVNFIAFGTKNNQ